MHVRAKLEPSHGVILTTMMSFIHINKTDYHGEVTAPKTKAAIRDIYLHVHMMNDIKEYLKWYKENNVYKDDYVLFGTFFKA